LISALSSGKQVQKQAYAGTPITQTKVSKKIHSYYWKQLKIFNE